MKAQAELYRELPSVDQVLHDPAIPALIAENGQAAVADACRMVLSRLRGEIAAGALDQANLAIALCGIQTAVEAELRRALGYSLRPLINATGVILHTNLGRAPLSSSALEHTQKAAGGYSNLEFDLDTGERGKRDVHVDRLFRKLLSDESVGPRPTGRAGVPVPTRAENSENVGTAALGCPGASFTVRGFSTDQHQDLIRGSCRKPAYHTALSCTIPQIANGVLHEASTHRGDSPRAHPFHRDLFHGLSLGPN